MVAKKAENKSILIFKAFLLALQNKYIKAVKMDNKMGVTLKALKSEKAEDKNAEKEKAIRNIKIKSILKP